VAPPNRRSRRSRPGWCAAASAVAIAAVLAGAAPAQAVTLVNPDGTPSPYQRWAARLPVPTVRARITVNPDTSPCQGGSGCTTPGSDLISFQPDGPNLYVLAHELGHQFDARVLSDADRPVEGREAPQASPPSRYFA
jgi:hypothetical protein